MPPRRIKQEDPESDEFILLDSQGSDNSDETALEKAIAMHYAATKEKKRQEKEKKFLDQGSAMLKKDLSKANEEIQSVAEELQKVYTNFIDEYAAVEDRIHHLWAGILKEHQILETFLQKKYDAGTVMAKAAEKQHIAGLSRLRAACDESADTLQKLVLESEGDDEMMMDES